MNLGGQTNSLKFVLSCTSCIFSIKTETIQNGTVALIFLIYVTTDIVLTLSILVLSHTNQILKEECVKEAENAIVISHQNAALQEEITTRSPLPSSPPPLPPL